MGRLCASSDPRLAEARFGALTDARARPNLTSGSDGRQDEEADTTNAPVLTYRFDHAEPPSFAELSRVVLKAPVRTDDGVEVDAGTSGTVVGVWPGGAAYEVDFPPGLATVEASKLTDA